VGGRAADAKRMIDLLYLSHNRLEFTKASLAALEANTDWNRVGQFIIYDDDSTDGTREYLDGWAVLNSDESRVHVNFGTYGHPVNVMRDYLINHQMHSIFAKIDSDTMVPPGWLTDSLDVMDKSDLDLLGIEAYICVDSLAPCPAKRGFVDARFIGGIGLMRVSAFQKYGLPEPEGHYQGFTQWQQRRPQVRKGWINPSLPVFLLDRLPFEPWRSLSKEYVEKFGQRDWGPYDENSKELWSWWA
jgi:Glycosyl transferase family 2